MSDTTLTPERIAELRKHCERAKRLDDSGQYHAPSFGLATRTAAAEANATLRAELATWKARAGEKWSQHDIDQAKKIGKLTNDLFAAYAERAAALAEVARLTDCNHAIPPVS